MSPTTSNTFTHANKTTHYLTAGPETGPLLIFVHGWPGLASTWTPQLDHFSSLGYLCVAADTHGYGQSSTSRHLPDFSLRSLVSDQLALLSHLDRKAAVWIGHDWGSPIVWSIASHHPEKCLGIINLCVPYRTLELGLDELVSTVNRDIYPETEYPYGQWDYQAYYERDADSATAFFDADVAASVKVLFSKGDPASFGKPARTAAVIRDGGWVGGAKQAPDIPLSVTVLDETLHAQLTESLSRNGFWPATAYYLNHAANREYTLEVPGKNEMLEMPVLFVEAKLDAVCATACSDISGAMRKHCEDLTEVSVEAGHWVGLEKAAEVSAHLKGWLGEKGFGVKTG